MNVVAYTQQNIKKKKTYSEIDYQGGHYDAGNTWQCFVFLRENTSEVNFYSLKTEHIHCVSMVKQFYILAQ